MSVHAAARALSIRARCANRHHRSPRWARVRDENATAGLRGDFGL